MRAITKEVLEADEDLLCIDAADLERLKTSAAENDRRRIRICAHGEASDPVHEMLIVHMRGVYVRPHKHVGKTESMHVVQGLAEVVFFDESGTVREVVPVGDPQSGRTFYYRLASPWYHTLSVSTDVFIFHEVTNGPFRREDTLFAPWSPDETDASGIARFAEAMAAARVPKDR